MARPNLSVFETVELGLTLIVWPSEICSMQYELWRGWSLATKVKRRKLG